MKPFLTLLLAATLLLATGCAIVRMERYVHEPTGRVPTIYLWAKRQALPKKLRPAEGEVLLVPDFQAFSSSSARPDCVLYFFTRGNRPVFIIDAELDDVTTGVKQSVALNIMTKPWALPNDEGYWGASVPLFDGGYRAKKVTGDDLVLTIRWRDGDRIIAQRLPLHRSARTIPGWID